MLYTKHCSVSSKCKRGFELTQSVHIVLGYRHRRCRHSMRCRVYITTVGCPSVRLSVPSIDILHLPQLGRVAADIDHAEVRGAKQSCFQCRMYAAVSARAGCP